MDCPLAIAGIVVHGDARGRGLGFPTANVAVPSAVELPRNGIYAGWLQRARGGRLASAISVGLRPTFYETARESLVEVHVLDWSGNLYGEQVRVEFVAWLREELRFENIDSLVAQMRADCSAARALLANGVA